jgi:hypothetical protein
MGASMRPAGAGSSEQTGRGVRGRQHSANERHSAAAAAETCASGVGACVPSGLCAVQRASRAAICCAVSGAAGRGGGGRLSAVLWRRAKQHRVATQPHNRHRDTQRLCTLNAVRGRDSDSRASGSSMQARSALHAGEPTASLHNSSSTMCHSVHTRCCLNQANDMCAHHASYGSVVLRAQCSSTC